MSTVAVDPQPPPGTLVRDAMGCLWRRGEDEPEWWYRDEEGHERDDPESWVKVSGNYGPVTVVALPDPL